MIKKIMLVDDHQIVRTGLKQIFAECTDIVVDSEAANGTEALDLLRARPVDGVLLDLSMPDRSGIDVLRRMRGERPDLPILILSMHAEEQYAMNVLKAGANGYIAKSSPPSEILKAVRMVLTGKKYVSPALAQQLATAFTSDVHGAPHEKLSTREFEVFCKLAAGHSVSDIADELFLSVKTVSTHRARILEKMNLRTNADLTYYAIKNELIQ